MAFPLDTALPPGRRAWRAAFPPGKGAEALRRSIALLLKESSLRFDADPALRWKMEHKLAHTFRVTRLAERLGAGGEEEFCDALRCAALLHDVGRFRQLAGYGTLLDLCSVDHGLAGARLCAAALYGVDPRTRRRVVAAVRRHNALFLYPLADPVAARALAVVRDADRIDNLGFAARGAAREEPWLGLYFHGRLPGGPLSPPVAACLEAGNPVPIAQVGSFADFAAFYLAWGFAFHLPASLALVLPELDLIAASLPAAAGKRALRRLRRLSLPPS